MSAPRPVAMAWLPVLLWGAFIWWLGTDEFSAPETSRILGPLVAWLWPDLDAESRAQIVAAIRKLTHPGVYGVLAGFAYRAAARTATRLTALPRAAVALLPVLALSTADEARQSLSASRTGAVFDVGLDLAGGLAVIGLLMVIESRLGRRLFVPAPDARSGPAAV